MHVMITVMLELVVRHLVPPNVTVAAAGPGNGVASASILLQSLFLCPSVLEPDLNDPHVEPCLATQFLPDMPRWFLTVHVGSLQRLQLSRTDRCPRSLVHLLPFEI